MHLNSFDYAGLQALGSWIAEPGSRPAAKLASYLKGLQFMRKLGLNPGTVILNLNQPIINNYSQVPTAKYLRLFKSEERQKLKQLFKMSGAVYDQAKFEGSEGMWTHLLGGIGPSNVASGRISQGKVAQYFERAEAGAGWLFRKSEEWNNLQAFSLAAIEAQRGRYWQTGRGWVRSGRKFKAPGEQAIIGLFSARRTQFGGRSNRAAIFRDPLGGLIFQFNTFNFRQTGLIGSMMKQSVKSMGKVNKLWRAGDKAAAGHEFADNVLAPFKVLMAMGGLVGGLTAVGFESHQAFGRVFGFLPGFDGRALAQGQMKVVDSLELGPTLSFPFEIVTTINNLATSVNKKPEMRALRIAELLATFMPIGEVELKRLARMLLDPRLNDQDRYTIMEGYKSQGEIAFDIFRKKYVPKVRDTQGEVSTQKRGETEANIRRMITGS